MDRGDSQYGHSLHPERGDKPILRQEYPICTTQLLRLIHSTPRICLSARPIMPFSIRPPRWSAGGRLTSGFVRIVRWRIGRPRRLLPSGSRRPCRLTRTLLNCWRPSRELCEVRIAAWAAQADHAQVNSSGLVRSTFTGRVTIGRLPHFCADLKEGFRCPT